MRLKKNILKKIVTEKLENKQEIIIEGMALFVFSAAILCLFVFVNLNESEINDYNDAAKIKLSRYSRVINERWNNIEEILNSNQLNEITVYENLIIEDKTYKKREKDSFTKSY